MRTYLAIACGLPLLIAGGIAALNYCVDPYLLHQWESPELARRGPHREKLSTWGKTYAIARYQPQVLYVGNSRTEVGLPVDVAQYEGLRVFNGALSGASMGDAMKMLRHASAVGRPETVIWGLDAVSFTLATGNTDLNEDLIGGGHAYLWWRKGLDMMRSISFDMSQDTYRVLTSQYGSACRSSLSRHGQRDGDCIRIAVAGNGGTGQSVLPRTGDFLGAKGPELAALPAFAATLEGSCSRRLRLYVNPTHAITLDALYYAGRGELMEQWLAAMADIAAQMRKRGCDVRIYDFSGFNGVTTESLPQAGSHAEMANFWEPSHYRENVGRMVLARLEGGADGADGFGAELLPERMEEHLAQLRAGLARYRDGHPFESALARKASMVGAH
jgi:hypothetical protein